MRPPKHTSPEESKEEPEEQLSREEKQIEKLLKEGFQTPGSALERIYQKAKATEAAYKQKKSETIRAEDKMLEAKKDTDPRGPNR